MLLTKGDDALGAEREDSKPSPPPEIVRMPFGAMISASFVLFHYLHKESIRNTSV